MRDILPFYFNRLEGEVIFADPKAETDRFWKEMVRKDRRTLQNVRCIDPNRPNVCIIGKPGKGKSIHLIEDETHNFFNPETEKIADKLRARSNKKKFI